jgi:hypothetical protein
MKEIIEPKRRIPVVRDVDVVVVGGGPAGFVAAVAAARNGARTLLIERYGFLGGMATSALVGPFGLRDRERPVVEGIPREFLDRLEAAGGALRSYRGRWEECGFDPEVVKYIADQMVEESGAELLLHSLTCHTLVADDGIQAVFIESKSGRQAITAKIFIDATGDGDIAALSGAPYEKGREEDDLLQPMTLMYRLGNVNVESLWDDENALSEKMKEAREKGEMPPYRVCFGSPGSAIYEGAISVNTTRLYGDATNVEDLTRAQVQGRKDVRKLVDFWRRHALAYSESRLIDTAIQVGVRETRRIIGEYVLTSDDVLHYRKFDDVIALGNWPIDLHDPTGGTKQADIGILLKRDRAYQIPYRCLLPKKMDNLLVAGRCISTTREANGSTRVMPICMAIGQAAGTAAALAVAQKTGLRNLEVSALQKRLLEQGAILE